jgi:class 3 adenylate cyclase
MPEALTIARTIGGMASKVPPVPDTPPDDRHAGAARLTGAEVIAINRFPDDNPNPVLRMDDDGHLIYANPASEGVRRAMGIDVGDRVPPALVAELDAAAENRGFIELTWADRTYAVWPVRIRDLSFTNLYGTDVTAERAIVKFPDQNPNPVLRIDWDGALIYANSASEPIVSGLRLSLGRLLPADVRDPLLERVRSGELEPLEVRALGRVFALVPVDIAGFGFINVYGTDVTAAREMARLAGENERLLLNILPEPIARRLRDGERLIADRFDDVTLLFADIVEFTRLSSAMSPAELVGVLNDVFTVFDELVDTYGLEKVKTIGDAYMVVGGMPEQSEDHVARVAGMALDLAAAVDAIEPARRLGVAFRIGIHCGPVVAGVIGTKKFIYDIWGDTVNLASRMESLGVPGRVHATGAVADRLRGQFLLEPRGLTDVKGKGLLPTWFVTGRAALAAPAGRALDHASSPLSD